MAADLAIEILREIRDGIRDLREDFNARLDVTNQRLDQTNERLDQTNQRLERVEHGLNDLGRFMRQIALDQAKHERFHSQHVERRPRASTTKPWRCFCIRPAARSR